MEDVAHMSTHDSTIPNHQPEGLSAETEKETIKNESIVQDVANVDQKQPKAKKKKKKNKKKDTARNEKDVVDVTLKQETHQQNVVENAKEVHHQKYSSKSAKESERKTHTDKPPQVDQKASENNSESQSKQPLQKTVDSWGVSLDKSPENKQSDDNWGVNIEEDDADTSWGAPAKKPEPASSKKKSKKSKKNKKDVEESNDLFADMLEPIKSHPNPEEVHIDTLKPKEFEYERKQKEQLIEKAEKEKDIINPNEIWKDSDAIKPTHTAQKCKSKNKEIVSQITHPKNPGLTKEQVSGIHLKLLGKSTRRG